MKEQGFRFSAVICLIGLIGTMGGFEWDMISGFRCFMQSMFFLAGMIVCHNTAEALHRAKRRRKVHR